MMKHSFQEILAMVEMQKAAAGAGFAELATEETWRELLNYVISESPDRAASRAQLLEVAALAVWALETLEMTRPPAEKLFFPGFDGFSKS